MVSHTKSGFRVETLLALPVIDGGLSKVEKRNLWLVDLLHGDLWKQAKSGGVGQNHPLDGKFSEFFYWGSIEHTDWRFCPNFMVICPITKKCEFIVYPLQNTHFFAAILLPFGPAKIVACEIWIRPTYVCESLSGFVKVCQSYSRKADFEQCTFCADMLGMTAYNAYNGTTIEISNLVRGLNAASSSLRMTNRPWNGRGHVTWSSLNFRNSWS